MPQASPMFWVIGLLILWGLVLTLSSVLSRDQSFGLKKSVSLSEQATLSASRKFSW